MTYHIRTARLDDVSLLQIIEQEAAQLFLTTEFASVVEDEARSKEEFEEEVQAGRTLVICEASDLPAGFVLFEPMDSDMYVRELDVHPKHAGQRLGARLIDAVGEIALKAGFRSLSLSTFRTVPFNGLYYAKLGFRVIEEGDWTPAMKALRDREAQSGLDISARVLMRWVIAKS